MPDTQQLLLPCCTSACELTGLTAALSQIKNPEQRMELEDVKRHPWMRLLSVRALPLIICPLYERAA